MPEAIILTLTGPDRIGIVDDVTGVVAGRGGNVEASRMARLGGEFAILMLVALPADGLAGLEEGLGGLASQGYKVTITPADRAEAPVHPGWAPYRIEVEGADHEGIIHEVAHYLSGRGISIEVMDSESAPASTSGVPLFAMTAEVVVPPSLAGTGWEDGLEELCGRLNLDVRVSPAPDR